MPLSKSELLKSRYIVEAPMPGAQFSHFLPGDMLEEKDHPLYQSSTVWGHADETDVCKWTTICPNYPHLFRPLPWHEKRELEDMPEYVRYEHGGDICFLVVTKWEDDNKAFGVLYVNGDIVSGRCEIRLNEFNHPATREEYEAYINGKTETK